MAGSREGRMLDVNTIDVLLLTKWFWVCFALLSLSSWKVMPSSHVSFGINERDAFADLMIYWHGQKNMLCYYNSACEGFMWELCNIIIIYLLDVTIVFRIVPDCNIHSSVTQFKLKVSIVLNIYFCNKVTFEVIFYVMSRLLLNAK